MTLTNPLAYYDTAFTTTVKSFILEAPTLIYAMKHFAAEIFAMSC